MLANTRSRVLWVYTLLERCLPMPDPTSGPFLSLAVICERVLQEPDGVLSLIRVVDRFYVRGKEKDMPMTRIEGSLVIGMKSGFCRGKYYITIRANTPSDETLPAQEFPVLFEGDDRGIGLVAPFKLDVKEEGLYWFDVLLQEQIITRILMRVVYQPTARTQSEPPPEKQ
jgi:hypothetical protein